ncbi:hypothetical protein LR48_Vigan05g160000 [Vigna angularis]|uniref:Uncharacterized protein n=1 Tax=Phaseolus angularis TaxID=3914 RepID=A0A0L9UM91_PHAAN|nr:hypothetical protein LR48_Vigan05g160000 [Vigna angularis]
MSKESRPVPRRESPWGITGDNHPEPKAHRCNDRVEDVIQACFEGNPFKTVPGPFKLFWQCMRSKPGSELSSTLQLYLLSSFKIISFYELSFDRDIIVGGYNLGSTM